MNPTRKLIRTVPIVALIFVLVQAGATSHLLLCDHPAPQ